MKYIGSAGVSSCPGTPPGWQVDWATKASPRLPVSTSSFDACICLAAQGLSTGSLVLPMSWVTCPGPSRLPWNGWAGSCLIGPRSPVGGSNQCTPKASQAKLEEASSGILPLADSCADAGAASARHVTVTPAAAMPRNSALDQNR